MDIAEPTRAIVPTLDGPVLRVLAATSAPASAREITRRVEVASEEGVRKTLNRLAHQGLLLTERVGPSVLYRLNLDHVAFHVVQELAELRSELLRRIAEHVARWDPPPVLAGIYGSFARGEGDADSDIDVLIVATELTDENVSDLAERIDAWSGNEANIMVLTVDELRHVIAAREPIVASWERELIPVVGSLRMAAVA